ncbi:MAG: hypothetical protein LQ346_001606 [Caloplaca aetnensis]|nr:MAG: hypothetical protein LQ346_001606 [Caloplaca aetnensis]
MPPKGSLVFDGDEARARQLPLARQYESFKYLKLTTAPSAGGTTALKASHTKAHLTGNEKLAMDDLWYKVFLLWRPNTRNTRKPLGEFKNCNIVTKGGHNDRFLLVAVYRNQPVRDEGVRFEPESSLGQSYVLDAPEAFPFDKN